MKVLSDKGWYPWDKFSGGVRSRLTAARAFFASHPVSQVLLAIAFVIVAIGNDGLGQNVESIAVPEGFVCDQIAGDELIHDAFSMTLDSQGRPVVSGPGYIRTLIDDNGDSIYDRFVTWSSAPSQGAQGLWSEDNRVYYVGDVDFGCQKIAMEI